SASTFAEALNNPLFHLSPGVQKGATVNARPNPRTTVALASLAALLLVAAIMAWMKPRATPPATERYRVALSPHRETGRLPSVWPLLLAIANDGSAIVFADSNAVGFGSLPLHVKEQHQPDAVALHGTEGGANPFFSPDGKWIGFATNKGLFKVARTGGTPVHLSDSTSNVPNPVFGSG